MKRIVMAVALLLLASAAFARDLEQTRPLDDADARSIDGTFVNAADEFGVPVDLLRAIAFVESRWTPHPAADAGNTSSTPQM